MASHTDSSSENLDKQQIASITFYASAVKALWETPEAVVLPVAHPDQPVVSHASVWRLYTSHFLSTLNSRVFEFAATRFLASVLPDTLRLLFIYALVSNAAAILCS
ncbi:hypothetical protein F5Y16DRAFT_397625 [Xylariaceae sp. FL0255]|nr:hypothetical protein F5Y16DRAFT_397625 [Xylariaceae sp. FL0255]